jgi:hypothetical protein
MKKILFFVFIITTLAFTILGSTSVLITPNSKLIVKGKTNINNFECQFNVLKLKNPIPVIFEKTGDKIVFDNTMLVLDNSCFDCGGKGINNDFQELLKSDLYPQTIIELKGINKKNHIENQIQAILNISIAGVTKPYLIPIELEGGETMLIKGILSLNICDFDLEPPKKALGLIVVKDTIEINFQLLVKEH